MAQEQVAPAAGGGEENGEQQGGGDFRQTAMRFMLQLFVMYTVMQFIGGKNKQRPVSQNSTAVLPAGGSGAGSVASNAPLRNLFGLSEECELFVHINTSMVWEENAAVVPSVAALWNESLAREQGLELLWHQRVWYEAEPPEVSVNITIPPLGSEVLSGEHIGPLVFATIVRVSEGEDVPEEHVLRQVLPIVQKLRELNVHSGEASLFGDEDVPVVKKNLSSAKLPYFKTKLEVRPVVDQTVHTPSTLQQGPFKKLRAYPASGFYQPYLYLSDFWLLEKDYILLNDTLEGQRLNLTLSYSAASAMAWTLQAQMKEQWTTQGEWGLTDTQRDSFMLKRLYMDTNKYLLVFSGCFLLMHTVFSLLAFKNDIQFWRKNESMQGLSARSMVVSSVCQFITTLYLLDSQETSRLLLFNIVLDTGLSTWKLKKAVKVELKSSFPFVSIGGQKGYENAGTNKYDRDALTYMFSIMTPLFIGYSLRSLFYGKHRGWWSYLVGSMAGGVYTFGFAMMTPQLYINYKLKSVEALPWRALTYKAMNTFVDDIAAVLIDMPMMHRLSCFRDDVIFFIYLYQRWKYRVDKSRPSMWVEQPEAIAEAVTDDAKSSLVDQDSDRQAPPSANAEAPSVDVTSIPEEVSVDGPSTEAEGVRERKPDKS